MTTQTSLMAEQVGLYNGQHKCGIARIVRKEWMSKHGVFKTILQRPIIIIDSDVFEKPV